MDSHADLFGRLDFNFIQHGAMAMERDKAETFGQGYGGLVLSSQVHTCNGTHKPCSRPLGRHEDRDEGVDCLRKSGNVVHGHWKPCFALPCPARHITRVTSTDAVVGQSRAGSSQSYAYVRLYQYLKGTITLGDANTPSPCRIIPLWIIGQDEKHPSIVPESTVA